MARKLESYGRSCLRDSVSDTQADLDLRESRCVADAEIEFPEFFFARREAGNGSPPLESFYAFVGG